MRGRGLAGAIVLIILGSAAACGSAGSGAEVSLPASRSSAPSGSAPPTSALTPSRTPGTVRTTVPPTSQSKGPGGTTACPIFPADNVWHADVSRLPVHRSSAQYVASIGAASRAHPDFGTGYGIPVTEVSAGQATTPVTFEYADESDRGPYPIPANVKIEGGGDRHIILYDKHRCRLYELFAAERTGAGWRAGSGAVFDLRSNALRPAGWTSADAAGLPILPGLVRYEEVAAGRIDHAIRMTAPRTARAYVWPARHAASDRSDPALPPMGQRFRLKSSVDTSRMPKQARVVAEAMKRYGLILADNGSAWYFTGALDPRWDDDAVGALKSLRGADFEAVDGTVLRRDPNSAAVR